MRVLTRCWGVVVMLSMVGCGPGPLPRTVSYRGVVLSEATTWSRGGLSGTVFVTPGQALPGADVQLGVMHSTEHTTGEAFLAFITEQFRRSDVVEPVVFDVVDESCKGGWNNSGPVRPFIALQVCRTGVGASACAELDEKFDDVACVHDSFGCFKELCNARWEEARAVLEPIVKAALQ